MNTPTFHEDDISTILAAVKFSAEKHRDQRRKGSTAYPYINHPIEVAETLWSVGGVRDVATIVAAILHDTIEDTETTPEELERLFGSHVRELVAEVTDDKNLSKEERKQLQVDHAPHKSDAAKQIKLGDKLCNVRDVAEDPPHTWSLERRREYLDWAERVVAGLRGANPRLEAHFDRILADARERI
jgi:guanosine-3',5'-bis(diphosphate) 3'-pyrophosphohydrolase